MAFPAEHFGSLKKRVWYKVRWMKSPSGMEVKGRFDLMMRGVFEEYKDYVEVLSRVETDECIAGLPVGFGKSEEDVDAWFKNNEKQD